jgi:hypothetical protein
MKRDMNLVREILLRLERGESPLNIPDYTNEQIGYHMVIMADGDLIRLWGLPENVLSHAMNASFPSLRWMGHEFLDDVRDPEAWDDTRKKIDKIGGASFQIVWELAKAYLRTHGLPF